MRPDKTTRVFLVLNEDTMEIETFNDQPEDQRPKLVARMFWDWYGCAKSTDTIQRRGNFQINVEQVTKVYFERLVLNGI